MHCDDELRSLSSDLQVRTYRVLNDQFVEQLISDDKTQFTPLDAEASNRREMSRTDWGNNQGSKQLVHVVRV